MVDDGERGAQRDRRIGSRVGDGGRLGDDVDQHAGDRDGRLLVVEVGAGHQTTVESAVGGDRDDDVEVEERRGHGHREQCQRRLVVEGAAVGVLIARSRKWSITWNNGLRARSGAD